MVQPGPLAMVVPENEIRLARPLSFFSAPQARPKAASQQRAAKQTLNIVAKLLFCEVAKFACEIVSLIGILQRIMIGSRAVGGIEEVAMQVEHLCYRKGSDLGLRRL
jgi:hypothetical protein